MNTRHCVQAAERYRQYAHKLQKRSMEFIWMFPIFFICPIIGLILIILGIIKIKKGKSKSVLFTGLSFFALPFIYLTLASFLQLSLEERLKGKYNIGNDNETLLLKDDGTFELKSKVNFLNTGNGTWKVEHVDYNILILNFKQKSEVWLEIQESENMIRLTSMFGQSNITNDLIKNTYSR